MFFTRIRKVTLMVILMLVGLELRAGADIKYHIINNQGKECFRYVIKGDYNYSSIDKTKLCVHPWARSVVATNFRFYVNKKDAIDDANGTVGSHFSVGDVISEVAPGTTEFYVRYSMKSSEELVAEGFTYDPDGTMTYLLQVRERNAKGGKRRQVYYDTGSDSRFEFGSPGANNTDIPLESLQKDEQYLFRVVSSDPYNTYFYNLAAEAQNPNGVLTVNEISRNNDKKAKERVTYETKISDYDPETTTTLQGFFFVAANAHILQSSWSSEYNGKMFIVGAVGGKDYWMRDVGSDNSAGGVENYVPYMLCANGNLGNFSDPGFQLQCYQSWRNHDYNNDNTGLVLSTPNEVVHEVRYHIVNNATKEDAVVIVQRHGEHSQFNLANRDKLQRIGCTLSENYYSDSNCTVAASALVGEATDVYIPYTFNTTVEEQAAMTATGLEFSTEDDPKWFSMTIRESQVKLLTYDATNNVIDSRYGATDDKRIMQESQFAFIGDPYSFRVICKAADGKYAFVDTENAFSYGNTKVVDNVRFAENPDESVSSWAMIPGERSGRFQIFLRDNYALAFRAFWDAQGGGNQIRLYSRTKTPEVHADANLRVTATPKYNYCYNIVDNSGRIAIKYTVEQYVSTRLDGDFGHKAIPSAIYSPYLQGETLTFYTTFTENNLASLAGEIGQTPNSSANIYVCYTQILLSTRPYPLSLKEYVMKLGDKFVWNNSGTIATQDLRPGLDDAEIAKKVWVLDNSDPYNVYIKNGDLNLLNSDIHFILMDGATSGQVEMLFANGADLATPANSQSLTLSGGSVVKEISSRGSANQQIIFSEATLNRTYRIIDKRGKIIIEYANTEIGTGDAANHLGVPEKWRSPLIKYAEIVSVEDYANSGYQYWTVNNFNVSGDTYTLRSEQTPITTPGASNDGYIYVTYDAISNTADPNYVDMNSSVKDIDTRVRRSATDATKVRDASKFGQMYMLKFKTSADYYLEDGGDDVETTATTSGTTVYPYTNGDGPMYIYTQARWDSQSTGGASTRTRWPWFILSPDNDPYHVMVSGWQQTHAYNSTSYYGYLRTYYNTEINQIITGNVSDDPRTVDSNGDRIMPTEYMLLGTKDHYKLLTTNEISDGLTTERRTLNSFEQYWRNNPTALWKKAKAEKGSALTQAEKDALKKGQSALATDDPQLATNGWHNYKAWVYAAPWDGSSKKYTNDDHWFMTVNVGTGEFELVPTEIDAVLVLLDNHGWEIMRKPVAKSSETARYETVKADLRKWDSPMVKQYNFYVTRNVTHKESGYHKYNIYDDYDKTDGRWLKRSDLGGTGTSLADYPEKYSGGALYDIYVTYDVKPEYAQAYTGAATRGSIAVNYPFLIRQNGKLAKATDATTLTTIESSSTGVDSGTTTGLTDDNLYWYLKPNFDIDIEMGYQYDVHYKDDKGDDIDDGTGKPKIYVRSEVDARYVTQGQSGFDPYNIQIYNKQNPAGFFTTDATAAAIVNSQYMKTTSPVGNGAVSLESAVDISDLDKDHDNTHPKFKATITAYDSKTLKITNQTFMAVQDANGNMRLMPRFDQEHVIEGFTALKAQAVAQPENDKAHAQTTWLLRPTVYTYYVIDNQGREALRYNLLSSGAPMIPAMFKSPLANDFTFYATYTTPGTVSSLTNKIEGSFADATGLTDNKVYVRYNYNPDADTDQLLFGTWYHATLNDGSADQDVKVTTGGIVKHTYEDDAAHRWRFKQSAGDEPDPYAVTLWNGTPATESSGNRYIVMHHFNGTDYSDYALMQAGTETATYSFLDYNSGTPTISTQSDYSSGGVIANTKKLKLTKVAATNSVIFKIITTNGKVALTSEAVGVDASTDLAEVMPAWLKTPIMEDDAYVFHSAADYNSTTQTYDIKGVPTTSPTTLDGSVVYVRYDYEKSKKAVTSFEMPDFDGLPYNYAPLDLSGNVMYTIGISSNDYGKIWSVGTGAEKTITKDTETDVKLSTELTRPARLWRFKGNDPYEVTIQNPSTSTTAVLAGKTPDSSASDAATPNDKYPLVKLVATDDATYNLNTFMVLKANPNEVTSSDNKHRKGTLKLYVTGNDTQYLAESNSLAGGVYIYKDALTYKNRLDASGEPLNPKDEIATPTNPMIIYSNFFYRPVLTYHIITNDKKEALKGYSLMAGTTVEIPEVYQSPLLNSSDFTYYTKATKEGSDYTVDTDASTAASTTIASLASKSIGDIYVRYTYSRANSPFKIATNIDDAAEDGTRLDWENEDGLDLSGDPSNPNTGGTWYTIADMQDRFTQDHGNVFGVTVVNNEKKFAKTEVNKLTNGRAPSNKDYLWKLMGNDPYAIRIYNAQHGQYLSVKTADPNIRKMSLQDKDADGYYQTFMLLEAHGNDNEIGDYGRDAEDNYNYQLRRWTSLIASGTKLFTRVTTDNDATTGNLNARDWDFDIKNFSDYDIRMSGSEVVTRQIINMGGGGTSLYCVEFVKAPVTRKYHYHAIQYDALGNKVGQTWDAILEHDWLQPVVLEDNIARLFCKYETKSSTYSGEHDITVTPTKTFEDRTTLNNVAQFYRNADLTERVYDAGTNTPDVYPEIDIDDVYHIYFKYQIDNAATVSGRKLGDITSTTTQIANDKAHYAETGRLDPGYYTGDDHGKWFFMVLDTDGEMSATGEEGSRTYTGNQYFLRREDNGTLSWMENNYTLHPQAVDNYNDWTPSRMAEWYKKGDNDPYREGRWLWTFVGTDPYNMQIVNMESVVGVNTNAEGVYSLAGADNCWTTIGLDTLSNGAIAYPVTVPTAEPAENQYWGISNGYGTEGTISLISTAITLASDGYDVNQPLYWNMQSRTINRKTTQSIEGRLRSSDRANAIQLIPYKPVKYQDINLVIKREDHVEAYKTWREGETWSGMTEYAIRTKKAKKLKEYDSGISLLYFTAAERTYVKGDKIDLSDMESLPINVRRAFCEYTIYSDDYNTAGGEYTVADGPYPTTTQATSEGYWTGTGTEGDPYDYHPSGDLIYDEDGKPVWVYTSDGTMSGNPASGAQSIYVKYEVTSDIFLKKAPTKSQVEEMARNNDHVYFMDFPTYDAKGNEITHHAFYDPEATTFIQTGDLSRNKDKNTGLWVPEKKSWSGSSYTSDTSNPNNATQYRTADDRMVSTPDKLKWYFVGDPYKLQVFSTAGLWNAEALKDAENNVVAAANTKQAQLARFNTVETNFKFVSDCVHIRLPNYTHIDNRANLIPTDERGVAMPEKAFPNRNNGKPYINDFYWECVPAASSEAGTFALRFKEDNDLLGYRNVYYYLGRDGKTMVYNSSEENPEKYHINLNYRPNNERYESGAYLGYHRANNDSTIIRLVQPVKVYITTNRAGDDRYSEQTNVTVDEYSGYYGLGETITGVPRHLQRKYVRYNDLTHNGITSGTHNLTIGNATSSGTCGTTPYTDKHSQTINDLMTNKASKEPVNPIFKFSVYYNVDDQTAEGIHLFSSCATPSAPPASKLTWLDVMVDSNNWFYYDKTNVDGNGDENQKERVSNYRRALSDNKSGWNDNVSGWTDGLKGLNWAFVGDPYDFTILNRRRYEDATINTEPMWLAAKKATVNNHAGVADSVVWSATLVNNIGSYTTNTSTATAALGNDGINAHWSLQMWKLGDANYYFLRTASLLNQSVIDGGGDRDIQTDNYWRMMAKHNGTNEFYAEPYALDDHSRYTSNKNNLSWNNYVTNDMRYSKTMNTMGVYEQRLQIRTAVEEDNDGANNDCFDAKVEIRAKDGTLRISKDKLEIKYGLAPNMLPYTLRRYGCEYTCYVNYNESTKAGDLLTRLRDSNTPMDEGESVVFAENEYILLSNAISTAKGSGNNVTLTYVYEVADSTAQFFTTASDALTEDYTWTNGYFAWDQTYSGTNVEVEYYVDVFDHYVYDANGQIIDAVYIKERRTRVVSNPDQAYPTTAFLNTHTNQVNVFADESTQSKDDRQKWALVGDPYEFTLKNYAQYLINSNATQLIDNNLLTQTTIQALAQPFAMGIDKDGNTFLSVIDGTSREITSNISFDFSTSSTKTTKKVGSGTNTNDPTGNTYDTDDVKPFKLASLLSYADILEYHLVIAHRHSLDPEETWLQNLNNVDTGSDTEIAQRQLLRKHLLEYLKYQEIRNSNITKGTYVNYDANDNPASYQTSAEATITDLLHKNGTMRDIISYPIADYSVAKVGIGNHPQVPWYMKRQFCKYYLYQRDVMRSQPNPKAPYIIDNDGVECYVWVNESLGVQEILPTTNTTHEGEPNWYKSLNIQWVSIRDMSYWDKADAAGEGIVEVKETDVTTWGNGLVAGEHRKKPKYYEDVVRLNGKVLDKLQECHSNRKVVVDVVYEVLPETFQFAYKGRNTTAWYTMMTNNAADGLLNFSYKDGIGARTDRTTHYTNNYLWAPEGDPYGFLLRSRYATINGSGWRNVAMTTKGHLPKESDHESYSETDITTTYDKAYDATYTNQTAFDDKRIIHLLNVDDPESTKSDGPSNAVYEMFTGDAAYGQSFLLHPTSAYIDVTNSSFESYYMTHETASNKTKLVKSQSRTLQLSADANWRLLATPDQLLPYFERAGYVGGLQPAVAQSYKNQDYYSQLSTAKAAGKQLDFKTTREIQELVYSGTFKDNAGNTVAEGAARPAASLLPMTFESTNLVNMTDGYYRIKGFSLPRYVSGYRFKSELTNSKPLRFFEKTKDDAWAHTFADLVATTTFTAEAPLRGNIELLPADFDPSSIFRFAGNKTNGVVRYTLSTQGLNVQGSVGATSMSTADGTNFRLDDIGGATVTLRTLSTEPTGSAWDTEVKTNIKTRYLTSKGDGYSLSIDVNNELNQTDGTDIQDTKWLLQPVGIREEWPYNEMPLRVEVNKGGVDRSNNEDKYYYGSLYVPFDTRLGNITDAAFTLTGTVTDGSLSKPGTTTMASVSQLNEMGNPQFVPAAWPVVLRSNLPGSVTLKNTKVGDADPTTYATKHYVNLYIPNVMPTNIAGAIDNIKLSGEYLEQTFTTDKHVMVFGLPFVDHIVGSDNNTAHHEYDTDKQVGFYTNDNWARETYYDFKAHSGSYPTEATVATDAQRSNTYVYNNKVYYVLDKSYSAPAPARYSIAIFDETGIEEQPLFDEVTDDVPWPCDVYDLAGRKVASQETPATLLLNHPGLPKGVYIFGGRKMIIR